MTSILNENDTSSGQKFSARRIFASTCRCKERGDDSPSPFKTAWDEEWAKTIARTKKHKFEQGSVLSTSWIFCRHDRTYIPRKAAYKPRLLSPPRASALTTNTLPESDDQVRSLPASKSGSQTPPDTTRPQQPTPSMPNSPLKMSAKARGYLNKKQLRRGVQVPNLLPSKMPEWELLRLVNLPNNLPDCYWIIFQGDWSEIFFTGNKCCTYANIYDIGSKAIEVKPEKALFFVNLRKSEYFDRGEGYCVYSPLPNKRPRWVRPGTTIPFFGD